MRLLTFLLLFCLSAATFSKNIPYVELEPESRQTFSDVNFTLPDTTWAWLGKKKQLVIGTWEPQSPPFDVVIHARSYEGINSDYVQLVTRQLALPFTVRRYKSRDLALSALSHNEIDVVVDDPGTPPVDDALFATSHDYVPNVPALVRSDLAGKAEGLDTAKTRFRLAVADNYLSDAQIKALYPAAEIHRYLSNVSAMSSVVFKNNDYMLGNLATVSFLIDYNYQNLLSVESMTKTLKEGGRFITRKADAQLLQAINTVIDAIPALKDEAIMNSWFLGSDFGFLSSPISFSPKEKKWIETHPVVKVIASPFYPPFSVKDKNGYYHGISFDVLKLISLRTGIRFEAVDGGDLSGMISKLHEGKADMIAALSHSGPESRNITFSRTYLFTSFVLVVKNDKLAPADMSDGMRIATIEGAAPIEALKQRYPRIIWTEVPNTLVGYRLVEEGKVDATISDMNGAKYIISRFFPERLKVVAMVTDLPAAFSFVLRRGDRELENILNKTLASIPVSTLSKVFNKWQGPPEVPLQTWRIFTTEHYIAIGLASLLLLSSLIWGVSLRISAGKRKKIQRALVEQLNYSHSLFEGSPLPTYVVGQDGKITTKNSSWDNFFVFADERILSLSLYDSRHPLAHIFPALLPSFSELPDRKMESSGTYIIFNGIENRTVAHWAVSYQNNHNQVQSMICGWQDITEHQSLMEAISAEKENAERASIAKGSFLATMSHEIRTPVSAIIGLLELAEKSRQAKTQDGEAIQLAYESAQSLLELIGDVLDMAKIEAGKLELFPEWFVPEELTESVTKIFSGLAQQKELPLTWHTSLTPNSEVLLDPVRLRQLLFNYVSNAIKFTESGSIDIRLDKAVMPSGEDALCIRVSDTGSGISENDLKTLFKPFRQLSAGNKQIGTGLGLVISGELLSKMNGLFDIKSQPGVGTTITLKIPTKFRQQSGNESSSLLSSRKSQNLSFEGLNILIVDDHPTNRTLLKRQLLLLDVAVTDAADGEAALRIWAEGHFDLIITDCQMPGMDGLAFTRAVRNTGLPVIIWGLTANAQKEEKQRCLDAGMDECLFKPVSVERLTSLLTIYFSAYAPPPTANQPLAELIDLESLRNIAQNNDIFVCKMLNETVEENQRDLTLLVDAIENRHFETAAGILHRLRGVAEVLDAPALMSSVRELMSCIEISEVSDVLSEKLGVLNRDITALEYAVQRFGEEVKQ